MMCMYVVHDFDVQWNGNRRIHSSIQSAGKTVSCFVDLSAIIVIARDISTLSPEC